MTTTAMIAKRTDTMHTPTGNVAFFGRERMVTGTSLDTIVRREFGRTAWHEGGDVLVHRAGEDVIVGQIYPA